MTNLRGSTRKSPALAPPTTDEPQRRTRRRKTPPLLTTWAPRAAGGRLERRYQFNFNMEGESQQLASPSAAVSKVLDDDDLLIEILLRVTFPTSLVWAALVCKRWLHHASDPAFLCHFRKLHPPRLLGFYIDCLSVPKTPCFVPMLPQPLELSAIICRRSFSLDQVPKGRTFIRDCENGRIVTLRRQGDEQKHGMYNPLFPERGVSIIPQFPCYQQGDYHCRMTCRLFVKDCDDLSYFLVLMGSNKEKTKSVVHVYTVRHGESAWRKLLTFSTDPLCDYWGTKVVLIDSKIYMPGFPSSSIIVLDLTALSYSRIYLPQGVDYGDVNTMLSRADDASGFYLVQAKELQLRIWVHKGDNWLMVETISLVEMCATANLRMSDCTGEDEHTIELRIKKVGDNAEFVFLRMGRCILYLDIKHRTLHKVYAMRHKHEGHFPIYIYPFKMIWPPIFPLLKDDLSS